MYDEILSKLKTILAQELDIREEKITPEAVLLKDLDVNSLEFLNIVMAVEEAFDIFLDEDRLNEVKTIDDVVRYLEELVGGEEKEG